MLIPSSSGFIDSETRRQVLLRGVNLSGSSKAPPEEPTEYGNNFWERAEKAEHSFVGRPFELEEADEHLRRLKGWGFNFIRYPITWESLEREAPGKYDYEFMDYTIEVLKKCKEWGFYVFMDPHQDVWSRFTGGSGSPFWTLPLLGINPQAMHDTLGAIVHHEWTQPGSDIPDPSQLPAMIWSTNYARLVSQTAFTLFFAGKDFAPRCTVDGTSIDDWLQSRFIEAFGKMADRIAEKAPELVDECIVGWDGMNEPAEGMVSYPDITALPTKQGGTLKKGPTPTPFQGMRLGMGTAQTVENWTFGAFGPSKSGSVTVDPKGVKLWLDPVKGAEWDKKYGWERGESWELGTCPWALHGVWNVETGECLKKDYFKEVPVGVEDLASKEFLEMYLTPFYTNFGRRIRQSQPNAIIFIQPPVFALPPSNLPKDILERAVYAPHYYEGLTLVSKHWNWFNADALGLIRGKYSSPLPAVKIGETAIRRSLQEQLYTFVEDTRILVGESEAEGQRVPVVIGEIGTPMDMDDKRAYYDRRYKGDYSKQETALDASLNGADGDNCLNYTVWTYCPDNSHQWGDGWNGEDLSLWSVDDAKRHLKAWTSPATSLNGADLSKDDSTATVTGGEDRPGMCRKNSEAPSEVPTLQGKEERGKLLLDEQQDRSSATLIGPSSLQPGKSKSPSPSPSPSPNETPTLPMKIPGALSTSTSLAASVASSTTTSLTSTAELLTAALKERKLTAWQTLALGTRAVRAFARPHPVKIVGSVKQMEWNIGKASFTCTIVPPPSSSSAEGREGATEIFVPLIHYASDEALTSIGGEDESLLPEDGKNVLDLEVSVSNGTRWEIEGQKLWWFYDSAASSSGSEEGEVWIEIKRKGGVLPFEDLLKGKQGPRNMTDGAICGTDGNDCVVM